MKQFKDAKGETWSITINGGTIKRAMDLLKVDLGEPLGGTPPFITRFDTNIAFKVDVLYVVCLPEADRRGIKDADFAERLEGDSLYEASRAFWEALTDFFQRLRQTHVVRAIQKQSEVVAKAYSMADETIASEAFDAKINSELAELGESFASTLQSPGPIPSPERSEN